MSADELVSGQEEATMAAMVRDRDRVVMRASENDVQPAVERALHRAGVKSAEELKRQAQSGDFETVRARMAWIAVGDLLK